MIWLETKITTTPAGAERLAGELLRLGVTGWQQECAQDLRAYLNNPESPFDYADSALKAQAAGEGVTLTLYLADSTQGADIIAALRELLPRLKQEDVSGKWGELLLSVRRRNSEDWEDKWKQYYKPFKIGQNLVVCPSWEEYTTAPGEKLLRIEPGGSFGTGQHYTTRLCLELLEQFLPSDAKLLDLGCGTGILSIGALHLGAAMAVGVDIEEHAAMAAAKNATMNGYAEPRYRALWGDILSDAELPEKLLGYAGNGGYDIITVNIVADVIMAMSGLFARLLAGAGLVIASGVIDSRREEVLQTIREQRFELLAERQENGWCAFAFRMA
ncbi:MAG TPA: 50S ribosomal protein L11 methyltransferase [Candidatus Avidehalobacter gallistercoris]|uniref:Ribosomal protein L11 methyltransferase n=1 Tax=Candidatus Avidehalobacter gallistercoris TaxID=2840694 RepID=A0A9D1HI20_9FIRM|nr:50S ribosomal protein L11 methyltransferase [Candidatus Avidehalobacter gallistercoris]